LKKPVITAALSIALLTGCAGAPSADAPPVTVTATTTVTATPSATPEPVATSGNYGADLAAAGTVPDDVAQYGTFMAKNLCESSLSQMAAVGSFSYGVERFGMPGSEASGSSPAIVRLTVAYFCPERASAAEAKLTELGYTK
jgi:hypothetical protein